MDPVASEPAKKGEDDMSSLFVGFATRMRKRAVSSQGGTTLISKVSCGKSPKRFSLDGEAQDSLAIITVDSMEWASDALLALEGAA